MKLRLLGLRCWQSGAAALGWTDHGPAPMTSCRRRVSLAM